VGFLIDTSLWIAVERGALSAADIHAITKQAPIYLSPVNIAEIRYGIDLMRDVRQKRRAVAMLERMQRKPLLRISGEICYVFGTSAAKLARAGRGADFRVQDVWLAAQAIDRGFTILTSNGKDFKDVPGLKFLVVNLR
jgi:predicted nucleic acid-binding protein